MEVTDLNNGRERGRQLSSLKLDALLPFIIGMRSIHFIEPLGPCAPWRHVRAERACLVG